MPTFSNSPSKEASSPQSSSSVSQPLGKIKGFWPYLIVVFLNAFVDLGHKITIQNTIFKTWDGEIQVVLTAIINGLILLPYVFLFTPAGFLADKFPKHWVMRWGALAAVVATVCITYSYYMGWFWMAFLLTLALAVQSAIYSPAKYGYIRELVGDEQLVRANGRVQATTIVAILAGTFVFSILFEHFYSPAITGGAAEQTSATLQAVMPLGYALIALACLEFAFTFLLRKKSEGDKHKQFDRRAYVKGVYLKQNLGVIRSNKAIWLSIIGLSVFMGVSQVLLAAFPAHAKAVLNESNTIVVQGLLAASGIGIVLGSLMAGRWSKAHLELGLIPVAAVGMTLGFCVLPHLQHAWSLALVMMLLGLFGGLFMVPLNALLQYSAKREQLGTVLAGNNWIQNLGMLSFLALTVAVSLWGLPADSVFYLLAAITLVGSVYTVAQLPHSLSRLVAVIMLRRRYRISVTGFDNLPKSGGVLLLGNHISWIDWALVQVACPRPVRFVMLRSIYEMWYLKPILKAFGAIPISPGRSVKSLEAVKQCLQNGEVVCLFPEGAISRNGQLGQFKRGYERAVQELHNSDAQIIPFYLRGLWGSKLSRSRSSKMHENTQDDAKRHIIIAFGRSLPLHTPAEQLKQKVAELSITAWEHYTRDLDTVPVAWLKQAKRSPLADSVLESGGTVYTNAKMMAATTIMARVIRRHCAQAFSSNKQYQQNVGILMPSSGGGIMANLAVMLNGQTAVNLNFTTGALAMQAAIKKAELQTVFTSYQFLKRLQEKGLDTKAMLAGVECVYLDGVLAKVSRSRWLLHFAASYCLPASWLAFLFAKKVTIESPAQILFSSGSEGSPKGIVLSHRNLMGNIKQISDVLNVQADDRMVATLPLFHSFGLTVNGIMPMVEGVPAVCHPDPTDVLGVATAIARFKGTILCGTATFFRLYTRNRKVDALMLEPLRIVIAGAEKLTSDVRDGFELKFKKTIYEGYGATETTPVASVNIANAIDPQNWKIQAGQKQGSVGLPLPGSCFRIVDPDTLQSLPAGEDGLIMIAGGQVMLGYLNDPQKTAEAIAEIDGLRWYKTGDKGHLDSDGFLFIVDRYSRFAKIGGEMVSLSSVEQSLRPLLQNSEAELAAANVKDAKKGEKVVLLVCGEPDSASLRQKAIDAGINPLSIPSQVIDVDAIPKLGSGKLDVAGVKRLAAELLAIDS